MKTKIGFYVKFDSDANTHTHMLVASDVCGLFQCEQVHDLQQNASGIVMQTTL